jgi:hypothetical protein
MEKPITKRRWAFHWGLERREVEKEDSTKEQRLTASAALYGFRIIRNFE